MGTALTPPTQSQTPQPPGATEAASVERSRLSKFTKLCKAYAWRLTCVWAWVHLLGFLTTGRDVLLPVERAAAGRIISALSEVGFAPANTSLLGPIFRIAWILTITEYSVLQFIGLAFYILIGPIIVVLALLFRKALGANSLNSATKQDHQVPQKGVSAQVVVISALSAWFLLYGGSNGRMPILLGILVTGILLAMRVYAVLSYTQPAKTKKSSADGFWLRFVLTVAKNDAVKLKNSEFKTPLEAQVARNIEEFMRFFVARIVLFFRGSRGQRRAGLLVLLQYVGNFLLLGVLAILFWALVIKFSLLPETVTFQSAFQASAAHVLPGLAASSLTLPWGLTACISATAWIMFVVYAGPAASAFPALQATYISRMTTYFGTLRGTLSCQNRLIRGLKRAEKRGKAF